MREYAESNDRMNVNDEVERMWKEATVRNLDTHKTPMIAGIWAKIWIRDVPDMRNKC